MEGRRKNLQKSYFDVLGICCPSEVPLVKSILRSMEGIDSDSVSVIVPSKTVIVVHDANLISQSQIEKALNQARLEATVRRSGERRRKMAWPTPYTWACGLLLLVSFLNPFYDPLKWFAVAAVAAGIPPIVLRSIAAVRRCSLDINILVLIAVAGSIALGNYWEAGVVVLLFNIAEWLQTNASYEATEVMSSLLSMAPQKAVLAESGIVVDAEDVKVNTILAVKAGEVVPIDGVVVEGRCEVDESSLTGESFPVAKQTHSHVWAGTLNVDGYISVKTTALAEHSAVAKMVKLVEEAQNSKSRINKLIDSCAKYYTPAVVLASAAVAVVPAALRAPNQRYWFHLALVLLVSACPCGLVLSTPVATFCALSRAAKAGLLIKGADFLEALAKTKVVAFDKTGTITKGDFTVMDFRSINDDICVDKLLYWVSSIESKSSHPMAAALVDHARSKSVDPKPDNVTDFQTFPGEGIYGEIDGKSLHVGSRKVAARAGCETIPNLKETMNGVTAGYVFSGADLIGTFSLSDSCRTGAAEAMGELKAMSIKTAMLTGDSEAAASYNQNQLGNSVDFIYAELLPEDKVGIIKKLKSDQGSVVMVGDGMNDAPAMMAADVGISMGISGSAVAVETGHVTLMSNDVRKIPQAIRLAKKTRRKIMENIIVSVTTKGAILALAFSGHPLLWAAVLADVGICLLVTFNSMLLLHKSGKTGMKCWKPRQHHHGDHQHADHCHAKHHHQEKDQQGQGGHRADDHRCGMGGTPYCKSKAKPNCCPQDTNPNEATIEKKQGTCSSKSCCHDKPTLNVDEANTSQSCCAHKTQFEKFAHEHTITIVSGETHHKENDHNLAMSMTTDHAHGNASCCTQSGVSGRDTSGTGACSDGTCSSSSPSKSCRRESGGCCKSYHAECRRKDGCCGRSSLHQLSEIITE